MQLVDDLEPFESLKLRILNVGHTVLVETWRQQSWPADESVRAILADAEMSAAGNDLRL